MKKKKNFDLSLYLITDKKLAGKRSVADVARQAIGGGATVIQLRDKNADYEEMVASGRELIRVAGGKIPVIVNDDIEVAMAIGAQGVHVGQKDMPAKNAREKIGDEMVLGVSAGSVEEAIKAEQDGADYIGAGPVFPTSTKLDADPCIGLDGLRNIKASVSIPVVAIGGISAKNAGEVLKVADGIAVVSAVMAADDPRQAAEGLLKIVKKKNNFMKETNTWVVELFSQIRRQKPLIHHITNFVVMNDTANITLYLGALPVMAHAHEEMAEMTAHAGALVLNIGTLDDQWIGSMLAAGDAANKKGIPIILDCVGAGATAYRTKACEQLINKLHVSVIKGNAGEIGALSGAGGEVRGVESVGEINDLASVVKKYALRTKATVVATGKRDIVSDGKIVYGVDNGDAWLSRIVGSGCMATSMIGAFCAVSPDRALASAGALSCFGLAAELAAKDAKGPASFKTALFDAVSNMGEKTFAVGVKIVRIE